MSYSSNNEASYIILNAAEIADLERLVNSHCQKGYLPVGSPFVTDQVLHQAVFRKLSLPPQSSQMQTSIAGR